MQLPRHVQMISRCCVTRLHVHAHVIVGTCRVTRLHVHAHLELAVLAVLVFVFSCVRCFSAGTAYIFAALFGLPVSRKRHGGWQCACIRLP